MAFPIKKIVSVIGAVAPWLATALGGPLAGAAASHVVQALNLTIKPDASTDDKLSAIDTALAAGQLTPEQIISLKEQEQQFQLDMKKAGFDHVEKMAGLAYEDVQSARQMQTQTKSWLPGGLAVFVTLGFFFVLYAMMRWPIPQTAHDALMLMLGSLGAAWTSVVAFYFGSSSDSHRKTELLAQAPPKQ